MEASRFRMIHSVGVRCLSHHLEETVVMCVGARRVERSTLGSWLVKNAEGRAMPVRMMDRSGSRSDTVVGSLGLSTPPGAFGT